MKTSTVNGATYELPEGWEPIESAPTDIMVNTLNDSGAFEWDSCPFEDRAIAWQPIVAPKIVTWKPKYNESYYVVTGDGEVARFQWHNDSSDQEFYKLGNCYPTESAAEAARPNVIAAHNGGAKWKGGV